MKMIGFNSNMNESVKRSVDAGAEMKRQKVARKRMEEQHLAMGKLQMLGDKTEKMEVLLVVSILAIVVGLGFLFSFAVSFLAFGFGLLLSCSYILITTRHEKQMVMVGLRQQSDAPEGEESQVIYLQSEEEMQQ